MWRCRCDCGAVGTFNGVLLRRGLRTSCGNCVEGRQRIRRTGPPAALAVGGGVYLPLPHGLVAVVDEADRARLLERNWSVVDSETGLRAACARTGRSIGSVVMETKARVVHLDGDTLNCRRENLREASVTDQNRHNQKQRGCSSRYKGVYLAKDGKWQAQIRGGGPWKNLGRHDAEEDAARAYDAEALRRYGVFARLNLPEPTVALKDAAP